MGLGCRFEIVPDPVNIFDAKGLEALRRQLRLDPQRIRRLRNAALKSFVPDNNAFASFPHPERLELHALELYQRRDSAVDGGSKLLFRTGSGLLTEAVVLRIATGRTTVCVSSQIGCAAACRFCATGKMGIARNLSTPEILDQVLFAGQLLATEDRTPRNIVFMGMGEPFHNEEQVGDAVAALTNPAWFALSPGKVLISTVGVIDGMLRFGERFPRVGLALSLHSVRQDVREQLIPLAKRYLLPELRRVIIELNRMQTRRVMLEYLMLENLTDTNDDLAALLEWTDGLDVHINLIPFNAIDEAPELRATSPSRYTVFATRLKAAGRITTVRHSLGRDIEAACGQLVRRENLALARVRSSEAVGRPGIG